MGNSASADTQRYLDGYPGEPDDKTQCKNLEFYSNKRPSKPDGDLIDNIHKKWLGNYGLLEAHHGYIQWLFPIREDGLNHHAQRLQLHEAKSISADQSLQDRIIISYELMLDFYGMKLIDKKTGEIGRGDNWKTRYAHLNRSFHNYLRITRILKCFGEIGLEHYKIHFVTHVLKEVYEHKELLNCHESCIKYWCAVLRSENERKEIQEMIGKYEAARPTRHVRKQSDSSDEEKKRKNLSSSEDNKSEGEDKGLKLSSGSNNSKSKYTNGDTPSKIKGSESEEEETHNSTGYKSSEEKLSSSDEDEKKKD